jgi:hypothetical protein
LIYPILLKQPNIPEKPSLIYRPKENLKFKSSEKPLSNAGGFFFFLPINKSQKTIPLITRVDVLSKRPFVLSPGKRHL